MSCGYIFRSTIAHTPRSSSTTFLLAGGVIGMEILNISGLGVMLVHILVSAALIRVALTLQPNATVTPLRQCNWRTRVSWFVFILKLEMHFLGHIVNVLLYKQVLSLIRKFYPLLGWVLDERNSKYRPVFIHWADSNASGRPNRPEYRRHVKIYGGLVTHSMDSIPSKDLQWWKLYSAISRNFLAMQVTDVQFFFSWHESNTTMMEL